MRAGKSRGARARDEENKMGFLVLATLWSLTLEQTSEAGVSALRCSCIPFHSVYDVRGRSKRIVLFSQLHPAHVAIHR